MKKGLLSILAVALTIVSCQNYDDQFAELTGLVDKLSTDVKGLSTVKGDLSSLTTLVTNLGTSIAQIPDPTTEITNIASGLASATTKINAIKVILDSGLATASDIVSITQTISGLQAGINTLLTKNATLVIDLVINDTTTLAAAKELVLTGDDSPAKYILTGNVNVDFTDLSQTERAESNLMTKKIISVSKSVTTSGTVDLTGLSAILDNYIINGTSRPQDSAITSIGGSLTVSGRLGDLNFQNLTTVTTNISISESASATKVDFRNVVGTAGTIQSGVAKVFVTGVNVYANATEVHTGALSAISIGAPVATAIAVGQTTAAAAFSIVAPKATAINANSMLTVGGNLSITATNTGIVHFDKMTNAAGSITFGNIVSEFHMPAYLKLQTGAGHIIWAKTVDATALAEIVTAVTFKGTTALTAPALADISGAVIVAFTSLEPLYLPLLDINAGSVTSTATTITIATSGDTDLTNILSSASNKNLTLTANKEDLALSTAVAAVTNLTITSGGTNVSLATGYTVTFDDASLAAMVSITLNGMESAVIGVAGGAAAATVLTTIVTSGEMIGLNVIDLDNLTTLTTGHVPMEYSALPAAARQSISIIDNLLLTAVDLTSVVQAMTVTIEDNAVLKTITAPAVGTALRYNAQLDIAIGGTGKSNKLSATHTCQEAGGALEDIIQPSLRSWRDYIMQMVDVQKVQITAGNLPANAYMGYDSNAVPDGLANAAAIYGSFSIDFDWTGTGAGGAANALTNTCAATTFIDGNISTLVN